MAGAGDSEYSSSPTWYESPISLSYTKPTFAVPSNLYALFIWQNPYRYAGLYPLFRYSYPWTTREGTATKVDGNTLPHSSLTRCLRKKGLTNILQKSILSRDNWRVACMLVLNVLLNRIHSQNRHQNRCTFGRPGWCLLGRDPRSKKPHREGRHGSRTDPPLRG